MKRKMLAYYLLFGIGSLMVLGSQIYKVYLDRAIASENSKESRRLSDARDDLEEIRHQELAKLIVARNALAETRLKLEQQIEHPTELQGKLLAESTLQIEGIDAKIDAALREVPKGLSASQTLERERLEYEGRVRARADKLNVDIRKRIVADLDVIEATLRKAVPRGFGHAVEITRQDLPSRLMIPFSEKRIKIGPDFGPHEVMRVAIDSVPPWKFFVTSGTVSRPSTDPNEKKYYLGISNEEIFPQIFPRITIEGAIAQLTSSDGYVRKSPSVEINFDKMTMKESAEFYADGFSASAKSGSDALKNKEGAEFLADFTILLLTESQIQSAGE